MSITINGAAQAVAALGGVEGRLREALAEAVVAEAGEVQTDEQAIVPVASGALQSGIEVTSTGELSAEIGVNDHDLIYAIWVEWGRSNAAAQPFATPAAELSRARWPQRVVDTVQKAVG